MVNIKHRLFLRSLWNFLIHPLFNQLTFLRCLHQGTHILNVITSHCEDKCIKAGNIHDPSSTSPELGGIVILPTPHQASVWAPICCLVHFNHLLTHPGLLPSSHLTYIPSFVSLSPIDMRQAQGWLHQDLRQSLPRHRGNNHSVIIIPETSLDAIPLDPLFQGATMSEK